MRAMTAEDDEAALVRAATRGDRGAFAALHARWAGTVHGVLLAQVRPAEAHDLVQDVFLKALRRLGDLRDESAFGPWLLAIARNRAKDFHRRPRPPEQLPDDVPGRTDGPAPEATEALAAIQSLPEAYRETLILRLVEGLSGPEIARRCGLTPGSVRVNLHRGMKQLRERLSRRMPHE